MEKINEVAKNLLEFAHIGNAHMAYSQFIYALEIIDDVAKHHNISKEKLENKFKELALEERKNKGAIDDGRLIWDFVNNTWKPQLWNFEDIVLHPLKCIFEHLDAIMVKPAITLRGRHNR